MSSSFFSVSLALRSTGMPSLVPASLAGPSDDHTYDDLMPAVRDLSGETGAELDIVGLD